MIAKATTVLLAAALAAGATAQERPIAITNARILTMAGTVVENGTVLIKDGKVTAVGQDVDVPAGYQRFDAGSGTLMPGLVSAYSHAGLQQRRESNAPRPNRFRGRGRRGRGGRRPGTAAASNSAGTKVTSLLYARQDVFGDLLGCGVTTIGLAPTGSGLPGLGAVLDPAGRSVEELAVQDAAFVTITPSNDTRTKKLISDSLAAAKKAVEERNKPEEEAKPKAAEGDKEGEKEEAKEGEKTPPEGKEKPADKPQGEGGEQKAAGDQAEAEEKKEDEKDENVEVLADLLEGKQRAFVELNSAAALLHYGDSLGDHTFPTVVVAPRHAASINEGRLDQLLDQLKKLKAPVLMSPDLTTLPSTNAVVNPARNLHAAEVEVGFIVGDDKRTARELMFKLAELVRHGLPREVALAGVTIGPARMLGLQDRVGTIEAGKDADLLLFTADPLDPTADLSVVWHKGSRVE